MAIKTNLPSNGRLVGLFLVLAIVLATFLVNYTFRPQASETVGTTACKATDVVLALHTANESKFNATKEAAKEFITKIEQGNAATTDETQRVQVGFVSYPNKKSVNLTTDMDSIRTGIDSITSGGANDGRVLAAGLKDARSLIESGRTDLDKSQKIIVDIGQTVNSETDTTDTDVARAAIKQVQTVATLKGFAYRKGFIASATLVTPENVKEKVSAFADTLCGAQDVPSPEVGQECVLDAVVVVEASNSMKADKKIDKAKALTKDLVASIESREQNYDQSARSQVAYVTFNSQAKTASPFVSTADLSSFRAAVDATTTEPNANIQKGLEQANKLLITSRSNAKKVIILISDGVPTAGKPEPTATTLKNGGVRIVTVTLGSKSGLMQRLASSGSGNSYLNPSATDLTTLFGSLAIEPCETVPLTVQLTASDTTITPEQNVTFTYTVTNQDIRVNARNVVLEHILPADLQFVDSGSNRVSVDVGTIAAGSANTITKQIKAAVVSP